MRRRVCRQYEITAQLAPTRQLLVTLLKVQPYLMINLMYLDSVSVVGNSSQFVLREEKIYVVWFLFLLFILCRLRMKAILTIYLA